MDCLSLVPDVSFSGVLKHTIAFLLSSTLSVLGSFLLLVGVALWTVIINKAAVLDNALAVSDQPIPLGIVISAGSGLYITWAAFACLTLSIIPYMLRYVAKIKFISNDHLLTPHSCCTYRG